MQPIQTAVSKCFWQGQLIRLRPFTPRDADVISVEEQDSESIRVFEPGIYPIRSAEMVQTQLEHDLTQSSTHILGFAVETLAGEMVGTTNIRDWQRRI
ncbi:MAG: hypothetical protein JXA33_00655 [Anaerolineae bacterium]|nr:hypothetical protein [Anaerolineae bacterium]